MCVLMIEVVQDQNNFLIFFDEIFKQRYGSNQFHMTFDNGPRSKRHRIT